jgi:hypothetical protein
MSIFGSVASYFGGSAKHVENSKGYANNAKDSLLEAGSSLKDGALAMATPMVAIKAVGAVGTGLATVNTIAGGCVSANFFAQAMKAGASFFPETSATTAINVLAAAMKFAAVSLVTSPLISMTALLGTTILLTHSDTAVKAVKGFGQVAYDVVKAGANLGAAVVEAGVALGLKTLEVADTVTENVVKPVTEAVLDYTLDFKDMFSEVDLDVLGDDYEVASDLV